MRYPNQAHTTAASWVTTNPTLLPLHIQPAGAGYDDSTYLRMCYEQLRLLNQLLAPLVEAIQQLLQLLRKDAWYIFAYFFVGLVVAVVSCVYQAIK